MRWLVSLLVVLFPAVSDASDDPIHDMVSGSMWNLVDNWVSDQMFDWPYNIDEPQGYPVILGSSLGVNSLQSLYWSAVLSYCDHSIVYDTGCNLFVCTESTLKLGFSNATFFNDYVEQNVATIYSNPAENQVVEAWKATTGWSLIEWFKNLAFRKAKRYCQDCEVHTGFLNHYLALADGVVQKRTALLTSMSNPKSIVVGFSLGSATATLSVFNAKLEYQTQSNVEVQGFVFGAPRVGNFKFAQFVFSHFGDNKLFRMQNWKDIIGFLPLRAMGFRAVGSEVWFARNAKSFEFTLFSKFVDEDYETGANNIGFYLWADSIMSNIAFHTLFFDVDQMEQVNACGGVGSMNSNINTSKPMFHSTWTKLLDEN